MTETVNIAANDSLSVIARLQICLDAMNSLSKLYFDTREENERLTRNSRFDAGNRALVEALDKCQGDVEKIKALQTERRNGIIQLEIRAFNEAELERQLERVAYALKTTIREALDYCDQRKREGSFDLPVDVSMALIMEAIERVQHVNKWWIEARKKKLFWLGKRDREECEVVVGATLAAIAQAAKVAVGNRPNGNFPHDSVFNGDAYRVLRGEGAITSGAFNMRVEFRGGSNWTSFVRSRPQVLALPPHIEQSAPAVPALQTACQALSLCQEKFVEAMQDLQRRTKSALHNNPKLNVALQKADSDEEIAAVARERDRQAYQNIYEYRGYQAVLAAAMALRDARAQVAALLVASIAEVEPLKKKRDYSVDKAGNHYEVGVYVAYCAEQMLIVSGEMLDSVGKDRSIIERYAAMQGEVKARIGELSDYARKQMF